MGSTRKPFLNQVNLIGRLTQDVVLKKIGEKITDPKLNVAVTQTSKSTESKKLQQLKNDLVQVDRTSGYFTLHFFLL